MDRASQTHLAWQAQQASLNHHILILHFHLVKLLFIPFIFSAFTTYDTNLHRFITHHSFFIFCLNFTLVKLQRVTLGGCHWFYRFYSQSLLTFFLQVKSFCFLISWCTIYLFATTSFHLNYSCYLLVILVCLSWT